MLLPHNERLLSNGCTLRMVTPDLNTVHHGRAATRTMIGAVAAILVSDLLFVLVRT